MNIEKIVQEVADKNLLYIQKYGYAVAGQNGPYKNRETPVRNSAHWITTYAWLWRKFGDQKYFDAVCTLTQFLLKDVNYGASGSIVTRVDPRFDSVNGLIGQAWAIEGLAAAVKLFVEKPSKTYKELRDVCLNKAFAIFKAQHFDAQTSTWVAIDADGQKVYDLTYNHQLWFAASGAELLEFEEESLVDMQIRKFLMASDKELFRVYDDGLLVHKLFRKLNRSELQEQAESEIRFKKNALHKTPFAVISKKIKNVFALNSFTENLEEGYHLFDLFGFALLKKRYGTLPVYKSNKLLKAIRYGINLNNLQNLSNPVGGKKFNKFAYGYNSPAFEYPFVYSVLADLVGKMDKAELYRNMESLMEFQLKTTYNSQNKTFSYNVNDAQTLDARVYELVRYLELGEAGFFARHVDETNPIEISPSKINICFVMEDLEGMGGRQKVSALLANMLAKSDKLNVSFFLTAEDSKVWNLNEKLDDRVDLLISKGISGNPKKYFIYKAFRFFNKKVAHIRVVPFLKKVYFPKQEIDLYKDFFNKHSFDVIIGVGTREAAMLSLCYERDRNDMSKEIRDNQTKKPELIAWYHNPWDVYFNWKNRFQWRQDNLYVSLLSKIKTSVVLTQRDREIYSKKLPDSEITTIYNPLTLHSSVKSNTKEKRVLFVGRLDGYIKGLDLLIEIFFKIHLQITDARLTIVGEGPGRSELETAINEKGLSKVVDVVGSQKDVKKFYLDSSIMLVTSRKEGFGLVVTEAMECGVPVLSFMTEGPSEIIDNGVNGILINNFDTDMFAKKAINLLSNESSRQNMAKNAVKRAEEFSEGKIVKQWVNLFENLV